jgi:hypothetical protein
MSAVLEAGAMSPLVAGEPSANRCWWRRPDHVVAVVTTIVVVFLHVCLTPNVGGLWRDEVNTVNLATLPTWHDVWEFHNQDSFPLLFASIVRLWSGLFGSTDDSLRVLGLLIGLGGVAAFWITARLMGLSFPFWSLVLAAANPMLIRYGDSVRGYGLSVIFLVLTFGSVWAMIEKLVWRRVVIATVTAVVSVHATYYNAVLLFAICAGGCFVALMELNWRLGLGIIGIGLIAAVSLLPYTSVFLGANDWNFLVQYPFTLRWMWTRLSEVTGSPLPTGVWIWSSLVVAAIAVAAITLLGGGDRAKPAREHVRIIAFCGVTLLVGIASYTGFLKLLNYRTQPWYYLSLITFVAICIDPVLWPKALSRFCLVRAAAAALLVLVTAIPAARVIARRHTNVDLVARNLAAAAAPDDLILLTRWECGVTFQRYYRGRAAWMTIPPLTDFRFQAYQPVIARMREREPLQPIIAQAAATIKSGRRIWLVGETPIPPAGEPPPILPPVGDGKNGWRGSPAFYFVWVQQVMFFLQQHFSRAGVVTFPDAGPVSSFENLSVHVVSGWK